MAICATCEHWTRIYHGTTAKPWGHCANVQGLKDRLTPEVEGYDGEVIGFTPDEDFGCVLHVKRAPAESAAEKESA